MERLDLLTPPENSSLEASIHLARYAGIIPLVKGKTVLDVACGEGYGSALLKLAGAAKVVGIDISHDAIDKARAAFSESEVEYIVSDVAQLEELFSPHTFDVVVSIETIEHVDDYEQFLKSLTVIAKPNAIFYVTCPNDHWYYPEPGQKNPYHRRKFTFEEFAEISSGILGANVKWGIGSPTIGFGTVPIEHDNSWTPLYSSWLKSGDGGYSFVVPNREHSPVEIGTCSFFTGIWNLPENEYPAGSSWFAISMDAYTRAYESVVYDIQGELRQALKYSQDEVKTQEEKLNSHIQVIEELERDLRHQALRLAAAQAENRAIRESLGEIAYEREQLQFALNHSEARRLDMEPAYHRYQRISRAIPKPLKKFTLTVVRLLKKR